MATFFSEFFGVEPKVVEDYGAFNVSLINDLPLFIDPFLLFNSRKPAYRALHDSIVEYLLFLKEKAAAGEVDEALLRQWYCFPEVKQSWLGFSEVGNAGHGLGIDFARALHGSLQTIFADFGTERITKGSHLEKVCLIKDGVGRDNISDFTTNLIKRHLYEFTESFALQQLRPDQRREVAIRNVEFNFETESWMGCSFTLPWTNNDHVVLTPKDLLTRDENWINRRDLFAGFEKIPVSIPDQQLRGLVNNYFIGTLRKNRRREPTKQEHDRAVMKTIEHFPVLIDYFIRLKESEGGQAKSISAERVRFARQLFEIGTRALQALLDQAGFYKSSGSTRGETLDRVTFFKDVIENKGGYRTFWNAAGLRVRNEKELQIMFRLVWFGTPSDISSEVNDGRGPADFKISRGRPDKTIVEMKLASNKKLEANLQAQAEAYQQASDAKHGIKVVVFFSQNEGARVRKILARLKMTDDPNVILIDARRDNKPSGSRAKPAARRAA
jgi:hypothetical protein